MIANLLLLAWSIIVNPMLYKVLGVAFYFMKAYYVY